MEQFVTTTCYQENTFALTYNCDSIDNIKNLTSILNSRGVRATFFVSGSGFDTESKEILGQTSSDSHQIASSGWTYDSVEDIEPNLDKNNKFIKEITGITTNVMRMPYNIYSTENIKLINNLGYYIVSYNADSEDYSHCNDLNSVEYNLNYYDKILNGDSIISVFNSYCYSSSILLTEQLINLIIQKGYHFVTIDECVGKFKNAVPFPSKGTRLFRSKFWRFLAPLVILL